MQNNKVVTSNDQRVFENVFDPNHKHNAFLYVGGKLKGSVHQKEVHQRSGEGSAVLQEFMEYVQAYGGDPPKE